MKIINTNGEAFIGGKVNTGGGKFIKGDKIIFEADLEDVTETDNDIETDEELFQEDFDFDFDLDEVAETDLTKLPPNVNLGGGKFISGNLNTKGKDFVGGKKE